MDLIIKGVQHLVFIAYVFDGYPTEDTGNEVSGIFQRKIQINHGTILPSKTVI